MRLNVHAQPIHQVDDLRPPIGHFLHRRLVLQKVAAIDRVVEVQPLVVALLPRQVVDAVDAALRTDAVRALDRHQAHQIDIDAQLGQLHRRRQARQSAADDQDALFCHDFVGRQLALAVKWSGTQSADLGNEDIAQLARSVFTLVVIGW